MPGIYYLVKGALRYELDEIDEATQLLETAVEMNPNNHVVRFFLAAAYAAGENLDEARWQVDEMLVLNPDFTLAHVERMVPIRDPNYRDRFLRDLQRAGLSY